jgi:PLP dependent protein
MSPEAVAVQRRLAAVRERITAAGGAPEAVTVVAVTKTFGLAAVRAALEAGLVELGENYAQELASKAEGLDLEPAARAASWHLIGPVQRNKVRRVAERVSLWQTVDRVALGDEIARRAPGAAVLVQVNTTGEVTKSGCDPSAVGPLLEHLDGLGLRVRGLMTVGPTDPGVDPRPAFAALRSLVERYDLEVCSMGMSGDLEAAVAEGSTMVRIGTALFGGRDRIADPGSSVG